MADAFNDKENSSFKKAKNNDLDLREKLNDIQIKLGRLLSIYDHQSLKLTDLKTEVEHIKNHLKKPWYKR